MERIYVDTNVYVDLLEKRVNYSQDLHAEAVAVFATILQKGFQLVTSDWLLTELFEQTNEENAIKLIIEMKDHIFHISYSEQDVKKAKELSPDNWTDALHAIIANNAGASYIITQNKRHFTEFEHLVKPKLPAEFF